TPTNTPTRTPTPTPTNTPTSRLLTSLSPARLWVGLASIADTGLRLDLKADVLVNGTAVGSGELDGINTAAGAFKSNMLNTVNLALSNGSASIPPGAQLQIQVSARRSCVAGGQVASGTARLWFDGQPIDNGSRADAGTRFDATIAGSNSDYYLHSGFAL